jgi:hypothetical protein
MRTYTTSDLAIAAFLATRGHKVDSAGRADGKFQFVLEDPEGAADAVALEFFGSEAARFDQHVRTLKRYIYK